MYSRFISLLISCSNIIRILNNNKYLILFIECDNPNRCTKFYHVLFSLELTETTLFCTSNCTNLSLLHELYVLRRLDQICTAVESMKRVSSYFTLVSWMYSPHPRVDIHFETSDVHMSTMNDQISVEKSTTE